MKHIFDNNRVRALIFLIGVLVILHTTSIVFAGGPTGPTDPIDGPVRTSGGDCLTSSSGLYFGPTGNPVQIMPCPIINIGTKKQIKVTDQNTLVLNGDPADLFIQKKFSADTIISNGSTSAMNLSASDMRLLCSNDKGEIIRCTNLNTVPPGTLNQTLRFDGTSKTWKATSKVSVTPSTVEIGFDYGVIPPNTFGGRTPLSVNGNLRLQGTNYKPAGSNETRYLRDRGQGVGTWSDFKTVTEDMFKIVRLTTDGYPSINGGFSGEVGDIWGAALRCPPEYPIALGGGGDCPGGKNNMNNVSSPVNLKNGAQKCYVAYPGDLNGTGVSACTNPKSDTWLLENRSDAKMGPLNTNVVDMPTSGDITTSNAWMYACSAVNATKNIKNKGFTDLRPSVYVLCGKAQ